MKISGNKRGKFLPFTGYIVVTWVLLTLSCSRMNPDDNIPVLKSSRVQLKWKNTDAGWKIAEASVLNDGKLLPVGIPGGEYTFLFSEEIPSDEKMEMAFEGFPEGFPEKNFRFVKRYWDQALTPAALNVAGEAVSFFPDSVTIIPGKKEGDPPESIVFSKNTDYAQITAKWWIDENFPGDVRVSMVLKATSSGYFSLSSPTVATLSEKELGWGMIPGGYSGSSIEHDLIKSYGFGLGLPDRPVITRERSVTTLTSIVENRNGVTLAAICEPGQATDPWTYDEDTRQEWRLGLSHMNRKSEITPTLYHPVIGQVGSLLESGDSLAFGFRYHFSTGGWHEVLDHTAYNVYGLSDFLEMKKTTQPLSKILLGLADYVKDDKISGWFIHPYKGTVIGAQMYGESLRKNSDYGAMWMIAKMTNDLKLVNERLPQARAFKLAQQDIEPGFFQGASMHYFNARSGQFTEDHGRYFEPVGLTYTLCDFGNILLFNPTDQEIKERVRMGADRLLEWQREDGSWPIAFDSETTRPKFSDLPDYRPTFYGLVIAFKVIGDRKYLEAARRNADWLLQNALPQLYFTGVCGDARFAQDFAVIQIAQALLDLYELTGEEKYKNAALEISRFYCTYIFTHPQAGTKEKLAKGKGPLWYTKGKNLYNTVKRQDWEINQTGLSCETGAVWSSAAESGPILLISHAGLFIRLFQMTGDSLFRDLARAGALARNAFINPHTGVFSYYWSWMDYGAGPWPHHAWWHIGWIMDYLLAEAELRSEGKIVFPKGFFPPKVGPQLSYGFAPGMIFGHKVNLSWGELFINRPEVDWILAESTEDNKHFAVLMNNSAQGVIACVSGGESMETYKGAALLNATGEKSMLKASRSWEIALPPYGLVVIISE